MYVCTEYVLRHARTDSDATLADEEPFGERALLSPQVGWGGRIVEGAAVINYN